MTKWEEDSSLEMHREMTACRGTQSHDHARTKIRRVQHLTGVMNRRPPPQSRELSAVKQGTDGLLHDHLKTTYFCRRSSRCVVQANLRARCPTPSHLRRHQEAKVDCDGQRRR
jgi:hypothetical protein